MITKVQESRRINLISVLGESGLNKSQFANKIGISRAYLSQLITPDFRFGERSARNIEERLRLPSGSLDAPEKGSVHVVEDWGKTSDLPDTGHARLRFRVFYISENKLKTSDDVATPPLVFPVDWIRSKNIARNNNLRVCYVRDDSMQEYLQPGDTVLIDMAQMDIVDNAVYAIRYGNEIRMKRLAKRFDGGLYIRSDNQRYPEEVVTAKEADQISVLGRLLWRCGG